MINNQIPGPTIEVTEGDIVEVKVVCNTPLPHTIHWHGLEIANSQDGVPYVTQDPIEAGESYIYRFMQNLQEHTSGIAIGVHCCILVAECMEY